MLVEDRSQGEVLTLDVRPSPLWEEWVVDLDGAVLDRAMIAIKTQHDFARIDLRVTLSIQSAQMDGVSEERLQRRSHVVGVYQELARRLRDLGSAYLIESRLLPAHCSVEARERSRELGGKFCRIAHAAVLGMRTTGGRFTHTR